MAAKPVTAKLRLRLELIAALPEPIMLDRLRRLSVAELIVLRRIYGIQKCWCKGPCKIQQFMLRATSAMKLGQSRRLAARPARDVRNDPFSMYQTRCQCAACRQAIPVVPFAAHELLAKRLAPEGETAPRPPRTRPNRNPNGAMRPMLPGRLVLRSTTARRTTSRFRLTQWRWPLSLDVNLSAAVGPSILQIADTS